MIAFSKFIFIAFVVPVLIVLEYCQTGNLKNILLRSRIDGGMKPNYANIHSNLTERQLIGFSSDIANGMDFLHQEMVRLILFIEISHLNHGRKYFLQIFLIFRIQKIISHCLRSNLLASTILQLVFLLEATTCVQIVEKGSVQQVKHSSICPLIP